MKHKLRFVLILFIATISMICCMGSQCKAAPIDKLEYEDFYYVIMTDDETGEQYIRLQGLTEQGKQKEYIVVPDKIDGVNVAELNYSPSAWYNEGNLESENLKKIYVPANVKIWERAFMHCDNLQTVILFGSDIDNFFSGCVEFPVFINSNNYDNQELGYYDNYVHNIPCNNFYFANVSFMYNYEQSPNDGYYWIDDVEYGTKIGIIPENPEREGYVFGGWFKEPECQNIWDFGKDTLPQQKLDEEGKEIYQETRLYAKWYKQN